MISTSKAYQHFCTVHLNTTRSTSIMDKEAYKLTYNEVAAWFFRMYRAYGISQFRHIPRKAGLPTPRHLDDAFIILYMAVISARNRFDEVLEAQGFSKNIVHRSIASSGLETSFVDDRVNEQWAYILHLMNLFIEHKDPAYCSQYREPEGHIYDAVTESFAPRPCSHIPVEGEAKFTSCIPSQFPDCHGCGCDFCERISACVKAYCELDARVNEANAYLFPK